MEITDNEINQILWLIERFEGNPNISAITQLTNSEFWSDLAPFEVDRCINQIRDELYSISEALNNHEDFVNAILVRRFITKLVKFHEIG